MAEDTPAETVSHLWQSTLFAAAIALALPIPAGAVRAQEAEPVLDAAFDVASFKRNVGVNANVVWRPQPTGEFTMINIPLIQATSVSAANDDAAG